MFRWLSNGECRILDIKVPYKLNLKHCYKNLQVAEKNKLWTNILETKTNEKYHDHSPKKDSKKTNDKEEKKIKRNKQRNIKENSKPPASQSLPVSKLMIKSET